MSATRRSKSSTANRSRSIARAAPCGPYHLGRGARAPRSLLRNHDDTTAVACIRTGRKCIGIEKEPKYFDIAVKRVEAEVLRTTLLDGTWKEPV